MNLSVSTFAFIQVILCLPLGIINLYYGEIIIGWSLILWSFMSIPLFEWIVQSVKKKIKAFTLIELVAVITILSVLLTVGANIMHTDHAKLDAILIKSELQEAHNEALITGEDVEFKLSGDYFSKSIEMSHEILIFNPKGEPINYDDDDIAFSLTGVYIKIDDGKTKPIYIYVKPFTGKISFY